MKLLYAALIFVVLLLHSRSVLCEDWSTGDRVLLGTAVIALAVDWAQTRDLARQVEGCYHVTGCHEVNPLLGDKPGIGKVNAYFALAIASTVGLSFVLPAKPRRFFLGAVTIVETAVIISNHNVGLRIAF